MEIKNILHWIFILVMASLSIILIVTSHKLYIYIIGAVFFSLFIPAVILSIREEKKNRI